MDSEPTAWILPAGWISEPVQRIGHCRSCDAPVLWYTSVKSGKRSPFNADGTSHFANCPQAGEWRKPKDPCGHVCRIPKDAHQIEEHPWEPSRA